MNENETVETQNETAEDAQVTEAGTEDSGHVFNVGDTATVIRGKLRGRKGEVVRHNAAQATYAVELEDGTLAVINAKNLKAPVDSTISVRALVGVLAMFRGGQDEDAVIRIAAQLDSVAPEVSVKLNEALAGNA